MYPAWPQGRQSNLPIVCTINDASASNCFQEEISRQHFYSNSTCFMKRHGARLIEQYQSNNDLRGKESMKFKNGEYISLIWVIDGHPFSPPAHVTSCAVAAWSK